MITTADGKQHQIVKLTWADVGQCIESVRLQLATKPLIGAVIGIGYGGWCAGGYFAAYYSCPLLVARFRREWNEERHCWEAHHEAMPALAVDHRHLLIVDDVVDSGATLNAVLAFVRAISVAFEPTVYSAALVRKPWSSIVPTAFALETDDYVTFPWERGFV